MSFEVLSREDLIAALEKRGVTSKFLESTPSDVVSSCKYHEILKEVEAGCFPFDFFINAHVLLEESAEEYTLTRVYLLATQTFHREVSRRQDEVRTFKRTGGWQDGLMS